MQIPPSGDGAVDHIPTKRSVVKASMAAGAVSLCISLATCVLMMAFRGGARNALPMFIVCLEQAVAVTWLILVSGRSLRRMHWVLAMVAAALLGVVASFISVYYLAAITVGFWGGSLQFLLLFSGGAIAGAVIGSSLLAQRRSRHVGGIAVAVALVGAVLPWLLFEKHNAVMAAKENIYKIFIEWVPGPQELVATKMVHDNPEDSTALPGEVQALKEAGLSGELYSHGGGKTGLTTGLFSAPYTRAIFVSDAPVTAPVTLAVRPGDDTIFLHRSGTWATIYPGSSVKSSGASRSESIPVYFKADETGKILDGFNWRFSKQHRDK